MLTFREHQDMELYEQHTFEIPDDDNAPWEYPDDELTEKSFSGKGRIAVGATYAYLLKKGSDLKSQVAQAKQSKDTNEKLDHLANAINLLSQRITAASALSYALAKSLKLR